MHGSVTQTIKCHHPFLSAPQLNVNYTNYQSKLVIKLGKLFTFTTSALYWRIVRKTVNNKIWSLSFAVKPAPNTCYTKSHGKWVTTITLTVKNWMMSNQWLTMYCQIHQTLPLCVAAHVSDWKVAKPKCWLKLFKVFLNNTVRQRVTSLQLSESVQQPRWGWANWWQHCAFLMVDRLEQKIQYH